MAYSNSSVAYDLPAYDLPGLRQQPKPQLKAYKSSNSSRRMLSLAFTPRALCSFAIVVTLMCLMVFNQVQLNEVSGEINRLNREIQKLQSENVRLGSKLEGAVNLYAIGEKARNELGMNRLDKHQIEYIYLQQEDKIVRTEDSPDPSAGQQIKSTVTSAITRIQEYIGVQ